MEEIKFLIEKINKAADRITELEEVVKDLAYCLGKITVCTSVKATRDLAHEAIKNAKSKLK